MSLRKFIIFSLLLLALALTTAVSAQPGSEVATTWFDLQLKLVRETPGFTPPVAARAFGYSGVTLYEAVVTGLPGYRSLAGQLNELDLDDLPVAEAEYDLPTAANAALAQITRLMFPTTPDLAQIDALEAQWNAELQARIDADTFERSVAYGQAVADAIYAWSTTDGGHEGYLTNFDPDYLPPAGAGLWTPTPRPQGDPLPALQPHWGDNRTFALESGESCAPPPHPDYSEDAESDFYAEALEVYEVTTNLAPEQAAIATFWSDDPGQTATPPGHSISILTQLLRLENADLGRAAEAYARMGIAVADSFIGCWKVKYTYNLLRPITYIQSVVDSEWLPLLVTPPFPEYPSGHSVQSGAAAEVLAALFGEDYTFTDHTHDSRGLPARTFTSFSALADEAAISRLYGGIHFRAAIERGLEQGRCIGEQVNALQFHAG